MLQQHGQFWVSVGEEAFCRVAAIQNSPGLQLWDGQE
jgi:hypothetical protein